MAELPSSTSSSDSCFHVSALVQTVSADNRSHNSLGLLLPPASMTRRTIKVNSLPL